MIAAALAAALAAQAPTPPDDPSWEVVGRDSHGEYAIDPASVARSGGRVRVLIRARSFDRGPPGTRLVVLLYSYDCRASTVRAEASYFYTDDGRPDGQFETPPGEAREMAVAPNTPNALVVARVCRSPAVAESTRAGARTRA